MEPSSQQDFSTILKLIESAKGHVSRAVNTALLDLYWGVGEYVSQRITSQDWGKSTVAELATYIQRQQPGLKGFSAQNIWRMRQFYDA